MRRGHYPQWADRPLSEKEAIIPKETGSQFSHREKKDLPFARVSYDLMKKGWNCLSIMNIVTFTVKKEKLVSLGTEMWGLQHGY